MIRDAFNTCPLSRSPAKKSRVIYPNFVSTTKNPQKEIRCAGEIEPEDESVENCLDADRKPS